MNTETTPTPETEKEFAPAPAETGVTPPSAPAEVAEMPAVIVEEKKHSPFQIAGAVVVALAILGGAAHFVYTNYYANGGIVAVVNGMEIYRKELDETKAIIRDNAPAYGIDATAPDAERIIETQSLELLITNAILLTAAEEGEFTVTDEAVEGTYQELVARVGGEENLRSQMSAVGLTDEKLRSNIRERELIDQYLEAETDVENITVSDEEVTAFVESLEASNIELPPLEEIRPQIESQLAGQKRQEIVDDLIEKLRVVAEIERRI